ncbi:HAMP domain-containing histidine kinase [Ramlibacter tataouinensis]|nr:HAMP domain-containing histidine kinase [Ramlibacter tataouinensis]
MTAARAPARHGLTSYLAFAFSVMSVLLAVTLSVVGERAGGEQVRSDIGANLAELANQTTSRLDRSMFERYREVGLMARRLGELPPDELQAEVDELQASYRYYAWIGATDQFGLVRAASQGMLRGVDVSARPWFRNALAGVHLGDVHDALLLSKLLGRTDGEPLRFFDVAFPMRDAQGRITGVLGAHVFWDWAADARQAIFRPDGRADSIQPLIVSAAGLVLLGPKDLEGQRLELPSLKHAASGSNGYDVETWPDGRRYLVGYAKTQGYETSPGLGWTVLVRQDLAEAYQPARDLQEQLLGWGLAMAVLFSLMGWALARALSRPLLGLAGAVRDLEAGVAHRVQPSNAFREVEVLGTAFNSMVDKLQRNQAEMRELNTFLERRVTERTAELSSAFERVRANEKRIQVILESAQDPFVAADLDGRVIEWNTRAEALFGWGREEVLGRSLDRVLQPARYAGLLDAFLKRFRETGRGIAADRPLERVVVDRRGREITVEVRLGLVDTGGERFFSAFLHDISARKEVERLKNELISTISHELRTPLTAIHGSLSLLQSGMGGELPPDARELVDISTQSSDRLIRLVNDVLDVEKIASGRMNYDMRPCQVATVVMQAIRDVQPYADEFGVKVLLERAEDATVLGDPDRLMQVVINLLSNATKFSPRGGSVTVSVTAAGAAVRVGVADHGPGIPEEFRGRIFERFTQADSSDRRQKGGTGLGLNICRSIIQAHHGRIDFDSEPGVRTEFWFELPQAPAGG